MKDTLPIRRRNMKGIAKQMLLMVAVGAAIMAVLSLDTDKQIKVSTLWGMLSLILLMTAFAAEQMQRLSELRTGNMQMLHAACCAVNEEMILFDRRKMEIIGLYGGSKAERLKHGLRGNVGDILGMGKGEYERLCRIARTMKAGDAQTYQVWRRKYGSGEVVCYTQNLFCVDEKSGLCGIVICDITRQMQLQTQLEDVIKESNQKETARQQYFSGVAHDLRVPIASIKGLVSCAQSNLRAGKPCDGEIADMGMAAHVLEVMTRDMMNLEKAESGDDGRYAVLRLGQLKAQMKTLFGKKAADRRQTLHFDFADVADMYVRVDNVAIGRTLMNLISNSHKYTPDGGRIDVRAELTQMEENHALVTFTVADTGMGMSQAFIEDIYKPYMRAPEVVEQGIEGFGMGMAMVARFVKQLGGTIRIDSTQGKGTKTTVEVRMQLADRPEQEEADLHGYRVLLAEDNAIYGHVLEELLSDAGARVDLAGDGRAALRIFEASARGTYHAVLTDMHMPEMDGYALAEHIRALDRPDAGRVAIIAVTGYAGAEERARAALSGIDDCLTKPVEPLALQRLLERLHQDEPEDVE